MTMRLKPVFAVITCVIFSLCYVGSRLLYNSSNAQYDISFQTLYAAFKNMTLLTTGSLTENVTSAGTRADDLKRPFVHTENVTSAGTSADNPILSFVHTGKNVTSAGTLADNPILSFVHTENVTSAGTRADDLKRPFVHTDKVTLAWTRADNHELPFVHIRNRLYLFNALCVHCSRNMTELSFSVPNTKPLLKPIDSRYSPYISISAWQHKRKSNREFVCCYIINIKSRESVLPVRSNVFMYHYPNVKLFAKHFTCPLPIQPILIKGVSIVLDGACPSDHDLYIKPTFIPRRTQRTDVAICAKIAYGSLDASRLVEWFEVQKTFGVTKVIVYVYKPINEEAMKVLKMYSHAGIAELYSYDIPEKNSLKRNGFVYEQGWADEQVALLDCQERLRQFKYVAIIDPDEYMIPETTTFNNSWITYLERVFSSGTIAGIEFAVRIHASDWGPTDNSSALYIGQYANSTGPLPDRVKNIIMPSRVKVASVVTHSYSPVFHYVRSYASATEASLHHYRQCRSEWLSSDIRGNIRNINPKYITTTTSGTICENFIRYRSDIAKRLADSVTDVVIQIWKQLNITSFNPADP